MLSPYENSIIEFAVRDHGVALVLASVAQAARYNAAALDRQQERPAAAVLIMHGAQVAALAEQMAG